MTASLRFILLLCASIHSIGTSAVCDQTTTVVEDSCLVFSKASQVQVIKAYSADQGCFAQDYDLGPKSTAATSISQLNITAIGVACFSRSYYLTLDWQCATNPPTVLLIGIQKSPQSASCTNYSIQPSIYKRSDIQVTVKDTCFTQLDTSSVYTITLSTQLRTVTHNYILLTPPQLHITGRSDRNPNWSTVVLVAIDSTHITLYIQPLPEQSEYSYSLTIVHTKGDEIQLESSDSYIIAQGATRIIARSYGPGLYSLKFRQCSSPQTIDLYLGSRCSVVQKSSFTASLSQIVQMDSTSGQSSSPSGSGVVQEPVSNGIGPGIQQSDLIIVLASVFGVVVIFGVIGIILFIYYRRRSSSEAANLSLPRFHGSSQYADGLMIDDDLKDQQAPVILLLYSYDFQQHLSCVQSLAMLLQNVLGCVVLADFWAGQDIAERGLRSWLLGHLPHLDYVIIICSTGVRFKTINHRKIYHRDQCEDDSFLTALTLLQARVDSLVCQKLVVCFDYSNDSDIPPLLENWQHISLPSELPSFMTLLQEQLQKYTEIPAKSKRQTDYRNELCNSIEEARQYMVENPNWFHMNIDGLAVRSPDRSMAEVGDMTDRVSQGELDGDIRRPIEVVTVEHNQSADTIANSVITHRSTDNLGSYHSLRSDERLSAITSPTSKSKASVESKAVGSSSSSIEYDMEHDIQFILHPTATTSEPHHTRNMTEPRLNHLHVLPKIAFTEIGDASVLLHQPVNGSSLYAEDC